MAAAAAAAAMAAVIDFTEQLTTATVYSQLNPFVTAIPHPAYRQYALDHHKVRTIEH